MASSTSVLLHGYLSVEVTPQTVMGTTSIPTPAGVNTASPAVVAGVASVPTPAVHTGSTAAPVGLTTSPASIPQPVVSTGCTVFPATVNGVASIPTPKVPVGAAPKKVLASTTIPLPYVRARGTKPLPSTTGVPVGTVLTTMSGTVNVNTAGSVFDSILFTGIVNVNAANCTFTRCKFTGGATATTGTGLVNCLNAACSNALFEDCSFIPASPNYWLTGILGHGYTARRCFVIHTVDGFGVYNTHSTGNVGVTLEENYVNYLAFFSPSPTNSDDKTHNDCCQWQGGTGLVLRKNNFQGFLSKFDDPYGYVGTAETASVDNIWYPTPQSNSALQVSGPITVGGVAATCSGLVMDSNWLDGGSATVNVASSVATNIGSITNNLFGHNQRQAPSDPVYAYNDGLTILISSGITATSTAGNMYEDNGVGVHVRGG